MRLPSGLNSAERTPSECFSSVISKPVWASHTRAVLSHEAVTTRLPSRLNCADITRDKCFRGCVSGWPVWESHTCAVPSWEAVTINFPSGLNSAQITGPACFTLETGIIHVRPLSSVANRVHGAGFDGFKE